MDENQRRRFIERFVDEARDRLDRLDEGVAELAGTAVPHTGVFEELRREAHTLKGSSRMLGLTEITGRSHRVEDLLRNLPERLSEDRPGTLRVLKEALQLLRGLVEDELVRELRKAEKPGGSFPLRPEAQEPAGGVETSAGGSSPPLSTHRTLRVSVERLDGLSALSAELTQIRLALEERKKEFRGLARDLREEDSRGGVHSGVACPTGNTARLALSLFYSRVLTDLGGLSELDERFGQETRELRLVPLTVLFEIVPGAVRRLAAQQGKEVQTTIQEGGALIDRRIAEELGAPLVHLISNTLTHGIEPPEERIRLGKPRCGLLSIEATQRGDRLVLEVRDDGAGIDIERLRRKAVDLRMMNLHSAGLLTEEQALQLIFQPGFTITRCADENSGRGAGLDAVRSAVENLGGRVGVATEPGRGTRFILDLPRALATLWTVLVEVGGRRFALPLSGLDGTFTAPAKTGEEILADIPALSGVEMPVVDLGALLGLEPRYPGLGKKQPLVVAKTPGGATAFAVEAIREERELVVRRLGQAIGPVPGIAGAAILGSGEVVLVLDLPSLTLSLPPRSP